ncbi:MAG: YbjQ family protein [Acidobacteriota bacterium]|nr:YbjQ family protein [Acidobacteriota bacterium]
MHDASAPPSANAQPAAQQPQPARAGGPPFGHGSPHMAYTSDLTGQEFWLVIDKGYIPLGLVLGNSVYSMGAIGGWLSSFKGQFKGEVVEVTQLMYSAREMALQRMQQEAVRLGADFVVGVNIKIEYLHGGTWMEVTALGTAVKYVGTQEPGRGQVVIPA